MLCALVFIFTSGSSALLGRPCCGLSIWLSLLAISSTLFWIDANFFNEKTDKTRGYSKSAIFVSYENGRRRLLGAQGINTDGASLAMNSIKYWQWERVGEKKFKKHAEVRTLLETKKHMTRMRIRLRALHQSNRTETASQYYRRVHNSQSPSLLWCTLRGRFAWWVIWLQLHIWLFKH